jgi:acetyl-CoA C-acetyltransferase
MTDATIVMGTRTPIGRFLGELSGWTAPELAGSTIRATVERAGIAPDAIDEVILGHVLGAGVGQAPAKQAAMFAGLGSKIGCATVSKVCGSGLYSVFLAARAIRCGDANAIVAGGMESMSNAPHLLRNGRGGWKYGQQPLLDCIEFDGLRCPHGASVMGVYAERIASLHGVDREAQDAWSLRSHRRACAAMDAGKFASEIVPLVDPKGNTIARDGGPRTDADLAKLAKLKPAFVENGTVTAGNASTLSDGSASVLVVSDAMRSELRCNEMFRIVGMSVHSQAPQDLFSAPVGAVNKLLQHQNLRVADIHLFEINEAFASQTVHCMRALEISEERLNIHGGAIALGHPIGCSGTRVLVSLMHALIATDGRLGVASLCLGGGEAVAILIERREGGK